MKEQEQDSYLIISIHAPTRGATGIVGIAIGVVKFQSTLPREERLMVHINRMVILIFQSTLPREERQSWRTHSLKGVNFNPRSHERSDVVEALRTHYIHISIHAPTRGATGVDIINQKILLFQSTLPREERQYQDSSNSGTGYFNPRSHERSDVVEALRTHYIHISIHAPTRGATAILHKKFVYFYTIPTINI